MYHFSPLPLAALLFTAICKASSDNHFCLFAFLLLGDGLDHCQVIKGKGEKERYMHLNAEFQRMARRDKKAFLSDQCKEIEENNRMGKSRDRFKKIRDTKGTFHAKMGTIKERSGMDLTEVEDVRKQWQQ